MRCDAANLNQWYYIEDLWWLIENLPDMIQEAKEENREDLLKVRLSPIYIFIEKLI